MKLGIIGNGFVGDAVAHGFSHSLEVLIFDMNPERSTHTLKEVAACNFVFVCVPTPYNADGESINLEALVSVLNQLSKLQTCDDFTVGTLLIKSTVIPNVVDNFCKTYPELKFISNPEFLTQRTARADFEKPNRIILGASSSNSGTLVALDMLYRNYVGEAVPIIHCTHDEAALIKMVSNCFSATKISFFNEVFQICAAQGSDYNVVINGVCTSGWVNSMHTAVPGPDGKLGFGGACFPKDMASFAAYAKLLGVSTATVCGAIETNQIVRKE